MIDTPWMTPPLPTRTTDETETNDRRNFVRIYGLVVYRHARRRGLGNADAVHVMREVLRSVARDNGAADSGLDHGTLDNRLFTLSCRTISAVTSTRGSRALRSGYDGSEVDLAAGCAMEPDPDWEEDLTHRIVAEAMSRVEGEFSKPTWQAFRMTAVEGRSAHVVGRQLRMSSGTVWVARCRVFARLGEEVRHLRTELEGWSRSAS